MTLPEFRVPSAVSHPARKDQEGGNVVVIIGIDPHKSSHTAAAVGPGADVLGQLRVSANRTTLARLVAWAAAWPERIWAVEGAWGLGLLLAQQLVAAGEVVVDVPSTLAARARVLHTGHGRKTDVVDAVSVATVALHNRSLRRVAPEDHAVVLRLLSDRRDELVKDRRRVVNRLHGLLRELQPGGVSRELSAASAAKALAGIRPATFVATERKRMARELLEHLRRLDKDLLANRKRCAAAVAASGTSLTTIIGISDVIAAKILGHTGDISRFSTAARFASYTGTAPIEASSGDIRRHRLSRAGNRALNTALHMAAQVQVLHPGPGQDYYRRKLGEQKTPREALRSLKRQLAKVVYRELVHGQAQRLVTAAA